MAVSYTFKDLAELGEHIRKQGADRRAAAPDMRSKRRADVALIEAAAFESVADIIGATKLDGA